ncbi:MAG: AAA family ATPase [Anaerolineae bacterium]|nr:AAA family ATPase [Anaerolineae bacterium]
MRLSERSQAWIVGKLLNGETPPRDPSELDGEWADYAAWVADGPQDETVEERWEAFLKEQATRGDDAFARYRLIRRELEAGMPAPVDDMIGHLPSLEWLWERWIPRGLISLLVAQPGTGKSYLALDLARRIAAGSTFPDGSPVGKPGATLYVDAENTPQVLTKRLVGWTRAERRRLYVLLPEGDRMMIDLNDPADRETLADRMLRVGPELVIIDSYGAVTVKGENAKEDVQGILAFLSRAALDQGCGMLIVHHLRKRSSAQIALPSRPLTIDTIRGSSHIPAMARNVIGMQWMGSGLDLDRNGPRRLHVIKSNLERYPPALGVYFEPHAEDPSVAALRYGEPPSFEQGRTKTEQCAAWLEELLEAEGAVAPAEAVALAEEQGYSERTVYRARKRLGKAVEDTRGWRDPSNAWQLAEEEEETDE